MIYSKDKIHLEPYISPLGAWAMSLGTTIGWGSLVVTCSAYLGQGGLIGSILGLAVGCAMMLVMARNYNYMMNCFPDAGGAYAYAKEAFGYDYGFLTSWFLVLTYLAIFWANATSLPLFSRYFIGDIFLFGKLYTIFGYDVYVGEVMLTIAGILLTALVCIFRKKLVHKIIIALAVIMTAGITVCFAVAMLRHGQSGMTYSPASIPDKSVISSVIKIAAISPWAFIGFENISHSSEELTFPRTKMFRIMAIAVLTATALYIFVMLLSASAYPEQYSSWLEYIRDRGNLSGIEGLPAFYAAYHYMGNAGIRILMMALLGLVLTSLIGNTIALSRLIYALAKDSIISVKLTDLNSRYIPAKAVLLVAVVSLPVPFLGRTAIGWIVDVTTIGATLIYGLVSASAVKLARIRNDSSEMRMGRIGLVIMAALLVYLLIPNLFSTGSMEKESYFLFVIWGILGFIFFRTTLRRDASRKFGHSLVVWIALLSLVLLISLIWMSQSMMSSTNAAMDNIHDYYSTEDELDDIRQQDEDFVEDQIRTLRLNNARTIVAATGLFAFALVILFTNYTYMNKRQKESEEELGHARAIAYTDSLTGVKNKRAYVDHEKEMDEAIASGKETGIAIAVCDVNGLKYINDTYGHKAGDNYIRAASKLLCDHFTHSPVYRIGGDEFVIVMRGRDYDNREELLAAANSVIEDNLGTDNVVISIGASEYLPETDRDIHAAFERADALMYERKKELKARGARARS